MRHPTRIHQNVWEKKGHSAKDAPFLCRRRRLIQTGQAMEMKMVRRKKKGSVIRGKGKKKRGSKHARKMKLGNFHQQERKAVDPWPRLPIRDMQIPEGKVFFPDCRGHRLYKTNRALPRCKTKHPRGRCLLPALMVLAFFGYYPSPPILIFPQNSISKKTNHATRTHQESLKLHFFSGLPTVLACSRHYARHRISRLASPLRFFQYILRSGKTRSGYPRAAGW
jgi:hypothetical protein